MQRDLTVRFWGVRGSIASPGPETAAVGGNTSCVEVRCGDQRIVLDAGTGLRRLGDALMKSQDPSDASLALLLSHCHWDHIQGLPFFVPAYVPRTKLHVYGGTSGGSTVREAFAHQMTAPVFPVRLDELAARIEYTEVRHAQSFMIGDVKVSVARGNHPGGVLAYRLDWEGQSVVYATDTEHYACVDTNLSQLADGADLLIYDAQYTPEEYRGEGGLRSKAGWGHSTYVAAAELARASGAGTLVLFHHDPQRTDAGVAAIEDKTRALFASTVAAREGMSLAARPRGEGTTSETEAA
ncbi:MAG: MBL fold metallo-hydrolase [Polyangiaceae bacterium]